MKILIVGGGGREHALAWKAAGSPLVDHVYVAPGNAGTHLENKVSNIAIEATDFDILVNFSKAEDIDLTIVGPEVPLVAGIVDRFQRENQRIFGPTANAAQLEGSKSFCKEFLIRHNIPTAAYESFSNTDQAIEYVRQCTAPIVVKADGLAAGKGVVIAETLQQAEAAVTDMLAGNRFGSAGSRVVIEEFLDGEELSFICMVGKDCIVPMATSQDHKARDEGDRGPNTGGMGAYSPAGCINDALHQHIMTTIIYPTVEGMASDGNEFTGFLYAGLMISPDGSAKVLEYNVRFGDPETQPVMMRLESDLVALCIAAIEGNLSSTDIRWSEKTALGVVLAAQGYPQDYRKGDPIDGLDNVSGNIKVFHAGTTLENDRVCTSGGRVLCATALGDNIVDARSKVYQETDTIHWPGVFYRRDIGHRAIET
ncbi:phosphoribosylamine--glycine ligase [Chromatiales bacterium (ex Bugula neritina AB1)]|nr:phosphoribosylamine--glycine ligase [Chromatiales bacterium (ex Bugula neritina AB1)]